MARLNIQLRDFVASLPASPLAPWAGCAPWEITSQAEAIVRRLLAALPAADYLVTDEIAVHRSTTVEAGSVVCNHRNERTDKEIWVRVGGELHRTGCIKFGAVLGDGCRLGANAVVAPGCLLQPRSVVDRVSLRDDEASGQTRGE